MDTGFAARLLDGRAGRIVEALHLVGRDVELDIEVADLIGRRPGDCFFSRCAPGRIDTDTVA